MKRLTLSEDQKTLITGLAAHAAIWTVSGLLTALAVFWFLIALVVGSVVMARRIGGWF